MFPVAFTPEERHKLVRLLTEGADTFSVSRDDASSGHFSSFFNDWLIDSGATHHIT